MKAMTGIFMLFIITGCGIGKAEYPPLKLYDKISIPDGEYLQYGKYIGGEKNVTIYYVTRLDNNSNHEPEARIYGQAIRVNSNDKLPDNYKDYSSIDVISLQTGSLTEQIVDNSIITNDYKYLNDPSKFKGEFYHHYLLKDGTIYYEYRILKGNEIMNTAFRETVKKDYPTWDLYSFSTFSFRYLDISKEGILYLVMPTIIKDPIPGYFKVIGKEKIKTGFKEFDAVKLGVVASDPFLGKLMESYSKDTFLWFEDSDRRVLLKMQSAGITLEIEMISNVISNI